jgi:hypothetical protein
MPTFIDLSPILYRNEQSAILGGDMRPGLGLNDLVVRLVNFIISPRAIISDRRTDGAHHSDGACSRAGGGRHPDRQAALQSRVCKLVGLFGMKQTRAQGMALVLVVPGGACVPVILERSE